ncbi:ABC transporter permease subunit [Lactiplantibacillus plantarum]|jgi:NitT/TauT family transport system permease protein|uniref:ABC transporter permease n=3 Tax=Bacillota TaxID=1239 RepID=A0A837NMS4_LACPN|nr:ABC transporter permease subunit [Lactiplantibacillus plantarum]AGE38210.1 Nitrate/sulfonate/bicarbonate ABC transporter, permease protein [Lactiplantibacillus plantarum ZJ316]ANI95873.1 ABC transporter permease [Lactiplantibacillus plantarum]ANJ14201.1 ABC transporter permease [Lactiplantibacillus plantarum]AWI39392.1 ABC transporter permease [Lactiplantibacillus plantarum]AYG27349.1 ABC transporter permease subunit [Lactiplantibacillus plantarum]
MQITAVQLSRKKAVQAAKTTGRYWKPWHLTWNIVSLVVLAIAYFENQLVVSQETVNNQTYHWFLGGYFAYLLIVTLIGAVTNGRIRRYNGHFAQLNVSLVGLLIVQDLLTEKFAVLEQPFFVSFAQILDQMRENAGLLWASTLSSLALWLISFVIGTILGILLGLGMGRYREFNYWAFPYLKVIGIIPAAAWMPLTMVIFPTSYMAEVFLIAFSVWFPVAFMTIGGVQGISKEYFESAKTLGFSEWQIIRKIVLPGALPSIFTGVYTAMGLSFTMLVISEMIGAKVGLGWFINWAKGTGNYTQVYAAIVIMAILFSVLFAVFTKVQDYCLRWRDGAH